ncbi:Hypothetical predicted protein [Xyrichtys novacula]|uniref:Uncharacterized protein n=1 Tax=Xyrichtys novacula TaxID=13765 RepID=A0AAV1FNK2_XYRNO|nr:Hypothetical predicted protein [Xyrichtys novacula]
MGRLLGPWITQFVLADQHRHRPLTLHPASLSSSRPFSRTSGSQTLIPDLLSLHKTDSSSRRRPLRTACSAATHVHTDPGLQLGDTRAEDTLSFDRGGAQDLKESSFSPQDSDQTSAQGGHLEYIREHVREQERRR